MIGAFMGPGARALTLDDTDGLSLMYHGWLFTRRWPGPGDRAFERVRQRVISDEERLDALIQSFEPSYFALTTPEYVRTEPRIQEIIAQRYRLIYSGPEGILYDLRAPADSP